MLFSNKEKVLYLFNLDYFLPKKSNFFSSRLIINFFGKKKVNKRLNKTFSLLKNKKFLYKKKIKVESFSFKKKFKKAKFWSLKKQILKTKFLSLKKKIKKEKSLSFKKKIKAKFLSFKKKKIFNLKVYKTFFLVKKSIVKKKYIYFLPLSEDIEMFFSFDKIKFFKEKFIGPINSDTKLIPKKKKSIPFIDKKLKVLKEKFKPKRATRLKLSIKNNKKLYKLRKKFGLKLKFKFIHLIHLIRKIQDYGLKLKYENFKNRSEFNQFKNNLKLKKKTKQRFPRSKNIKSSKMKFNTYKKIAYS